MLRLKFTHFVVRTLWLIVPDASFNVLITHTISWYLNVVYCICVFTSCGIHYVSMSRYMIDHSYFYTLWIWLFLQLFDLEDSKEAIYGTLDAWVAWEQDFPIAALKNVMLVLEKNQQWHRVIQVLANIFISLCVCVCLY